MKLRWLWRREYRVIYDVAMRTSLASPHRRIGCVLDRLSLFLFPITPELQPILWERDVPLQHSICRKISDTDTAQWDAFH